MGFCTRVLCLSYQMTRFMCHSAGRGEQDCTPGFSHFHQRKIWTEPYMGTTQYKVTACVIVDDCSESTHAVPSRPSPECTVVRRWRQRMQSLPICSYSSMRHMKQTEVSAISLYVPVMSSWLWVFDQLDLESWKEKEIKTCACKERAISSCFNLAFDIRAISPLVPYGLRSLWWGES